jgi:hypothetical protein
MSIARPTIVETTYQMTVVTTIMTAMNPAVQRTRRSGFHSDRRGDAGTARPSSRQHTQVFFDRIAGGLRDNQKWLEKATDAISTYWRRKNGQKRIGRSLGIGPRRLKKV